jgi:hypothetical protein
VTLYHYCCSCSARRITARGFLHPHGAALFGVDLVWLTDQAVPDREGLGLTSHTLKCDRLEYQYVADVAPLDVERWLDSKVRRRLIRSAFGGSFHEFENGRQPEAWWIARRSVFAIRNRAYRQPLSVGAVDPSVVSNTGKLSTRDAK